MSVRKSGNFSVIVKVGGIRHLYGFGLQFQITLSTSKALLYVLFFYHTEVYYK